MISILHRIHQSSNVVDPQGIISNLLCCACHSRDNIYQLKASHLVDIPDITGSCQQQEQKTQVCGLIPRHCRYAAILTIKHGQYTS